MWRERERERRKRERGGEREGGREGESEGERDLPGHKETHSHATRTRTCTYATDTKKENIWVGV